MKVQPKRSWVLVLALAMAAPASAQAPLLSVFGGASEETCRDVAFDSAGNLYAAGGTESPTFPTTNGSVVNAGAYMASSGPHDVWVRKYSPAGALLWSIVIGGRGYDRAYAIEVNATGVYVAGRAGIDFPTTTGAFQETFNGDSSPEGFYGPQDGFVLKLDHDGVLQWATYVGTSASEIIRDFDVDATGATYLGLVGDGGAPFITAGSYDTTRPGGLDAMPTKLSPDGSTVVWSTYLGGSNDDGINPSVRVDPATGNVWIASFGSSNDFPTTSGAFDRTYNGGSDIMLSALSADGSALVYSTYYGGSGDEAVETHALAISGTRLALSSFTTSTDLPTTSGVLQQTRPAAGSAYVALFDTDGTHVASTYLGASGGGTWVEGVGLDSARRVYVAGGTDTASFPPGASGTRRGTGTDGWLAVLSADLTSIDFAERVGGTGEDNFRTAAVTPAGRFGLGGLTHATDFPSTDGSSHSGMGSAYDRRDATIGWFDVPSAPCADGATRACYTGDAGTEGGGRCAAGTQTCAGAAWGACTGQVLPATEACTDGADNDCDGTTDGADADCGGADGGLTTRDGGGPFVTDGGGVPFVVDGGSPEDVDGGAVARPGTDAGVDGVTDGGCACRASASSRGGPRGVLLVLLAVAALGIRRRRG